nr:hypothetical protein [Tanacetum cinerariifolium]
MAPPFGFTLDPSDEDLASTGNENVREVNVYSAHPYHNFGKQKTKKGQNQNKTGQKREAWKSPALSNFSH